MDQSDLITTQGIAKGHQVTDEAVKMASRGRTLAWQA